jgi:hypothetical protein
MNVLIVDRKVARVLQMQPEDSPDGSTRAIEELRQCVSVCIVSNLFFKMATDSLEFRFRQGSAVFPLEPSGNPLLG